jgi:hypothetical protein
MTGDELRKESPVTTSVPDRESRRQRDLEDGTRRAWAAYRESLRDLQGRDYDEAEGRSWDRLQRRLRELQAPGDDATGGDRGGDQGRRPQS